MRSSPDTDGPSDSGQSGQIETLRLPFHHWLALHSLLIGLLPFYLPVFLWQNGYSLAHLSLLIGVSGFAFCGALFIWQRLASRSTLAGLLAVSFALELLLVLLVVLFEAKPAGILLLGIANGLYNGIFWTTQRTLFLRLLGSNDTGRRYGNFQLFVTVFLKVGILLGGWLLDSGGLGAILLLSVLVSGTGSLWLYRLLPAQEPLLSSTPLSMWHSLRRRDTGGATLTFRIDGVFLFLESHFWTLSLFLIVREDFSRLGGVVVILALSFAILFFLIKNSIDALQTGTIYRWAVVLYAASWLLRTQLDPAGSIHWLMVLLVIITFCSSFFRLAFNKRFFDLARQEGEAAYLVRKSQVSQAVLGVIFSGLGIVLLITAPSAVSDAVTPTANASADAWTHAVLQLCYLVAAAVSLLYLAYRPAIAATAGPAKHEY